MEWNNNGMSGQQPINLHEAKTKAFFKRHGAKAALIAILAVLVLILLSESLFVVG